MLSRTLLALLVTLGLAAAPSAAHAGTTTPTTDDLVVASFNVLGADHTDGRRPRHGFDDSVTRMNRAITLLRRTQVDLVGLQEFQDPQYAQFTTRLAGVWDVFTGDGPTGDTDNSIAWRVDRFEKVDGWSVAVPYFHGNTRYMPVVHLRSLRTGRDVFVMNTHNPADTRGDASAWRRRATEIERSVTRRLSNEYHAPVIMTGDMNDRADFFCPFTENGVMRSFIGGVHRKGQACQPPARMGVDWILGNRFVQFGTPRIDRSALVSATTDHPLVSSRITLH